MDNVPLKKIKNKRKKVGRPFDEHRCFYIKDFRKGDSIRVRVKGELVKGIVTDIDLNTMEVVYKTSSSEGNRTFLDDIGSLESYQKDWLN